MAMSATEGPKRPLPDDSVEDGSIVLKKQKTESALSSSQQKPGVSLISYFRLSRWQYVCSTDRNATSAAMQAPSRTSGLLAPIMLLTGHAGEVFGVKFSPDGSVLASCSHDKHLFLWNVYGECDNFMVLKGIESVHHMLSVSVRQGHDTMSYTAGHKNAVLDVQWTNDGEKLLSASPDKTVRIWDVATGAQTKKMTEHDNFVNSCSPLRRGPPLLASGSDDSHVKVKSPIVSMHHRAH